MSKHEEIIFIDNTNEESSKNYCKILINKKRKSNEYLQKNENLNELKSNINQELNNFKSNYLNFYFVKILKGLNEKYNNNFTLTISEILSKKFGLLKSSCQFNYMFDIDWLINQYDLEFRKLPLTIVAQNKSPTVEELTKVCSNYSNIQLCFVNIPDKWGTHHTKMMLLHYTNGLRVVIHTSNCIPQDWTQKTQGIWLSDLLPPLSQNKSFQDLSPANFQTDLIEYIESYNKNYLKKWIALIKRHDFSSVKVALIGSVPGRHCQNKLNKFGHLKLKFLLHKYGPKFDQINKDNSILAQFSSIGNLGRQASKWLTGEFLDSLKSVNKTNSTQHLCTTPSLKIIFPTLENVRTSLEGYLAGSSIPYHKKTAEQQPYLKNFMHKWKSDTIGRTRAMPHIKTYLRLSDTKENKLAWFVLTSANLSKAAWGCLEKNATQLNIRSYELGVLFLPLLHGSIDYFKKSSSFTISGDGINHPISFILPYDLPLTGYDEQDEPWIVDLTYTNLPDSYGNIWVPK